MPDKEKVINELTEIYDEAYDRWVHRPYIEDKLITLIKDGIPDALAILREQEVGQWIRLTGMAPPEFHGHKICSVCNCLIPYDPIHPWREMLTPYCPACGAKMDVNMDG
ncbi:MAG: hypothetical protein IKS31_00155 [Clostridia bacterium]|nr:hypothetical protein [Clostridia bacterium]